MRRDHTGARGRAERREAALLRTPSQFMKPRMVLYIVTFALVMLGLLMVYSSSSITSLTSGDGPYFHLIRQVPFVAAGLVAATLVALLDYHWYTSKPSLVLGAIVAIALLVLVFTPLGVEGDLGTRRWAALPGLGQFQPSEFAKILIVLVPASAAALYVEEGTLGGTALMGALAMSAVLPLYLILKEPDLGTVLICVATLLVVAYVAGLPGRIVVGIILGSLALGSAVFVIVYFVNPDSYQLARILVVFDPWAYADGDGWQLIQGFYAFGSGGLLGTGIGHSAQKYAWLPMADNDFIFAIIGEELGLLGTVGTIALFVALAWAGLQIARHACDLRGRLVATACTGILVIQAFVNIGGVIGVIPLTGKPLPFISNGGSSMVSCLVLVGLIVSVSRHSKLPETVFDERRRSWWVSAGPPTSDESSQAGEATPRSARHLGEGAPSLGGLTVVGGSRSAAARSLGARGASTASPTSPEGIRAARALSSRVGGGRVSVDASGRRRIDLGPSASERLRGPR